MRILNKYITANIAKGYFFILFVFVGLYFIIDIFSTLSDMLKSNPPITVIVSYYLYMIPLIFLRVGPFALLISTLYVFGDLNKHNEITTMRASGVSMMGICLPVVVLAALLSATAFYTQEKVLMETQKKVEEIKMRYIKKENLTGDQPNFAFPYDKSIFFARYFSPKTGIMEDVTIFEEDQHDNIIKKIICKNVIYKNTKWYGLNAIEYNLDAESNIVGQPKQENEMEIKLSGTPREIMARKAVFTEFASIRMVRREIKHLKKARVQGNVLNSKIIDYHQKISGAFAHFFIIFAVLPFAAEIKKRRVTLSALGTGFIFGFAYYCVSGFTVAIAKSGMLLPALGVWIGPMFFIAVGLTAFYLMR
jgi:lipopolysaccharide export system permease protein